MSSGVVWRVPSLNRGSTTEETSKTNFEESRKVRPSGLDSNIR